MNPSDKQQIAAYEFIQSVEGRADADKDTFPLWHGWALREAFLAGIEYAKRGLLAEASGSDNDSHLDLRVSLMKRHFEEAMTLPGKMSNFAALTGLTESHLWVAQCCIVIVGEQIEALEWAIRNDATPAEMIGWHRLQNG